MRAGGHISPTATFSMIARDKKTHKTVFTSLQGPEEVIKELLGSTVTNDHGIMQRLLPVTWTDTTFGLMVAPPLDYALYCKDNRRRL